MYSKRIKTTILLTVIISSILLTIFFIFNLSNKNHNLKDLNQQYDLDIESIDNKQNSLNPNLIFNSLDKKELNQSIDVNLKSRNLKKDGSIVLYYEPAYNKKLFEYIFLKNIIRTFPQWKVNTFTFQYDYLLQRVWVKYTTETKDNYLDWFFKIISKIED